MNTSTHQGRVHLIPRSRTGSTLLESVVIAERDIQDGPLPEGAVVHHKDENPLNNNASNLQILPSLADHRYAHRRLNAFKASGNWDWLNCRYCKKYDDPKKMYILPFLGQANHKECRNLSKRNHYANNKELYSLRAKERRMLLKTRVTEA